VDDRPATIRSADQHVIGGIGSPDHLYPHARQRMPVGHLGVQLREQQASLRLLIHGAAAQVPPWISQH
jgi:hypothetical protein